MKFAIGLVLCGALAYTVVEVPWYVDVLGAALFVGALMRWDRVAEQKRQRANAARLAPTTRQEWSDR